MKKYFAEMIGTMVLVLMGCGSAVLAGPGTLSFLGIGLLGISLAFGLSVLVMAYAIGPISGCHVNPAVTFGMWVARKISGKDAIFYVLFQIIGAFIGIGILAYIFGTTKGLACNQIDPLGLDMFTVGQGVVMEIVMTFIFLMVIFGSTSEKAPAGFGGLAIGLSLTLIHLATIPVTNCSVNPARSIAPAVLNGGLPLEQLWIFILAPLVGAGIAALCWLCFEKPCKCCKKEACETPEVTE